MNSETNSENMQGIMNKGHILTSQEINESIDGLELGDMSEDKNYLAGLKRQLNEHWSKVKAKLNEDINLNVEYTGIGVEPYIKIGNKIKNLARTDLGDMSGEKSYLVGLKRHLSKHWSTVKEKLNEDVNLKIEYKGLGAEPFIELGKKIKNRFTQSNKVMILGQDDQGHPVKIYGINSIALKGLKYDFKLDLYHHEEFDSQINIIGTKSAHSIENISKNNIQNTKAFVIYISLGANDPLDEYFQYIKIIEKYEVTDAYILVVFMHEKLNQHIAESLKSAIILDNNNKIDTIEYNPKFDNMADVVGLVVNQLNQ